MSKFICAVVDEHNSDWVNVHIESNFDEEWVFSFPYKVKNDVVTLRKKDAWSIDEYEEYFDDLAEFREGVDGCKNINDLFTLYNKEITDAVMFRKERDAFVLEYAPTISSSLKPINVIGDFKVYEFEHERYKGVTLMFAHNTKTNEYFIVDPN